MNPQTVLTVAILVGITTLVSLFVLKRDKLPNVKEVFIPLDWVFIVTIILIPVILICFYAFKSNRLDLLTILRRSILLVFGYLISIEDIRAKRIPNNFILGMMAFWVFLAVPQLLIDTEAGFLHIKTAGLGFLVGGGLFLLVYIISKRGLGGGDVKFMAATGLYIGFKGILPVMLYGSVLSTIVGVTLIILKRVGRKDTMPLAPFLYIGILITVFAI